MNMLRYLGLAAVLAASGVPPAAVVGPGAGPSRQDAPARGAPEPREEPAPPVPAPRRTRWPFASEGEDLGADDFEGEGWTFWPL